MRIRVGLRSLWVSTMVAAGWVVLAHHPLSNHAVFGQTTQFYKDKTIRVIVGFTSGGLYDQYARILARHMPKHIPGNPSIIVQNMPGAGSLTATNYVYGVAKPDGLTLGMPGSGIYPTRCSSAKRRLSTSRSSRGSAVSTNGICCST